MLETIKIDRETLRISVPRDKIRLIAELSNPLLHKVPNVKPKRFSLDRLPTRRIKSEVSKCATDHLVA